MSYQVRDLMINVIKTGGQSGTALPADDGTPIPTPITPVAITLSAVALSPQIHFLAPSIKDALKTKAGTLIDRNAGENLASAVLGNANGSAAVTQINRNLNIAVMGAAVLQFGGGAGMPNPDCGGSSMETIPTPITPIVDQTRPLLQASQLPVLKATLTKMLTAVQEAEKTMKPTGRTAAELSEKLKAASEELARAATSTATA